MPPIPSEKLSKLAGEPVAINLKEGETLDQAEDRVLKENPDYFRKATDFASGLATNGITPELREEVANLTSTGDSKNIAKAKSLLDINKALNPEKIVEPKPLSGDAAKLLALATGGIINADDLKSKIESGNLLIGQALPFGIGDRDTDFLLNDLSDRLGRVRSGGAITEGKGLLQSGEKGNFQDMLPGMLDFSKSDKLKKIERLKDEFYRIGSEMKGGPEGFESYLQTILKSKNPTNAATTQTQTTQEQPQSQQTGLVPTTRWNPVTRKFERIQ